MPEELAAEFTLDFQIPVLRWYINDSSSRPLKWTARAADFNFRKAEARKQRYYGETDSLLYAALDDYPIAGLDVVIVGSESPWYECICVHYGAKVTTIEYRDIENHIPGVTVLTPQAFAQAPRKFDVVVSISSIEHDGLGRYGDPINPVGDLEAMNNFRDLLKPDGFLILAVPIGRDAIVWNAHRIYGLVRFPMLIDGWLIVDSFGFREELFDSELGRWDIQPVWVLKPDLSAGDPDCAIKGQDLNARAWENFSSVFSASSKDP